MRIPCPPIIPFLGRILARRRYVGGRGQTEEFFPTLRVRDFPVLPQRFLLKDALSPLPFSWVPRYIYCRPFLPEGSYLIFYGGTRGLSTLVLFSPIQNFAMAGHVEGCLLYMFSLLVFFFSREVDFPFVLPRGVRRRRVCVKFLVPF